MRTLVRPTFGINNMTREKLKSHISFMVQELHCDSADVIPTIADGTYSYIQKSADNKFQRQTYSVQKGRPLVKPLVWIASDGYIIRIFGPFHANWNFF